MTTTTEGPISTDRSSSWTRLAIEGIVVMGSILLAFGIDAAWDGRGEAHRRARSRTR